MVLGDPQHHLPLPEMAAGIEQCGLVFWPPGGQGPFQGMLPPWGPRLGSTPQPVGFTASGQLGRPLGHAGLDCRGQGHGLLSR